MERSVTTTGRNGIQKEKVNMKKTPLIITTILLLGLIFPSIQATAPVVSNENPADGSQLSTEPSSLCIDLNDSDGDNMYWEIWQGGNLLENGTPFSYPTHTYTFNNCTTPHHAYWSSDDVPLKMTGDVEFTCSNYTNVSAVDNLNVTTNATVKDYTHHHFLFNISEDPSTITNVDVNWHGYAGAYLSGAKPKWYWDATMYFNMDAPGWYTAGSTTLYTTNPPNEEWLNYTLHHDINDWLDDNGILELAIQNTYAGQPSIVHTDYIEVVVTYRTGGDPNGTYCTSNVSWWNNNTCEQWWTWNVTVYDGVQTTDETYTFQNMPCVLSAYFYPMNQSTGICPCCDAICFGVGGLYTNVNVTVYGREQGRPYFNIWNEYENITNNTYCFCMDTITPTIRPHAVFHKHTQMNVTVINTWYNVSSFMHGCGKDMVVNNDNIIIPSHGHYTIDYWAAVRDDDANPTGHKMGIRVTCNDVEIDGSYRELAFTNQGYEKHLTGNVHGEFFEGDIIKFQYIGDDTDQEIATHGTWSDDSICFYGFIRKTGMEEHHPLQYNTTYEWYIYAENYYNNSMNVTSGIYQFTTAEDVADCVDTGTGETVFITWNTQSAVGLMGLAGLICIPILLKKRKKKEDEL